MQSTGAAEEAFMAAGKLMDKIESNFERYMLACLLACLPAVHVDVLFVYLGYVLLN